MHIEEPSNHYFRVYFYLDNELLDKTESIFSHPVLPKNHPVFIRKKHYYVASSTTHIDIEETEHKPIRVWETVYFMSESKLDLQKPSFIED